MKKRAHAFGAPSTSLSLRSSALQTDRRYRRKFRRDQLGSKIAFIARRAGASANETNTLRKQCETERSTPEIEVVSNATFEPDDVVLDPFCGCGTTIHAAQKLDGQWIGIDITYLAINLIKRRLKDAFGEEIEFEEKGQPTASASAKRLAELDKFQFQHWPCLLLARVR